ncbi:MAG TPA: glycosyltransferase family 39 protein [Vicinamibacteria bacterium]
MAAALALYAALAVTSLRRKSATFDECAHLPAAYTHLALQDYRLSPDHPPLVKHLAALPLLLGGARFDRDDPMFAQRRQWELGRRFLYRWNDADTLFLWGRSAIVLLGALLAVSVFLWARRLFGARAAALALFLCVLNPEMLAHGQLVTTDLGAALFIFLAVVAFERLTEQPTPARVALAGAALGAGLATKFSALGLLPILAVLAVAALRGRKVRPAAAAAAAAGMAATAVLVIWAAYGFHARFSADPAVDAAIEWQRLTPENPAIAQPVLLARRLSLLPDPYLFGFFRFFKHSESRPAFLLGRRSEGGSWYYFPVTFLVKTPLALLALLGLAVATRARAPAPLRPRAEAFVWLPVAVYLLMTLTRGIHIGHRHLLPIYPFLFVAAGRAAAWAFPGDRPWRDSLRAVPGIAVAALCAWQLGATLWIHPHYLAYFNELVGGPRNGYRLLADSNLDWGQDLKELRAYLERRGITECKLSYFGTADPEYHHVPCRLLPGYMLPRPRAVVSEVRTGEWLAVSATNLQGLYVEPEVEPLMALLRQRRPVDQVGYSILIYRADFDWSAP